MPLDHPILSASEDILGRAGAAHAFAQHVLELDASRGLVVGVLGPWGAGKTSFINLARATFESAKVNVIDFNPWMFSGVENLLDAFFREVSQELRLRPGLADVGTQLAEYGEAISGLAWIPVVGPWTDRVRLLAKLASLPLRRATSSGSSVRRRVEDRLRTLAQPVVVVLDDVDRLTTAEIRHVFKLVRLTASFPNLVYLVAVDRLRVEQALTEDGIPGRDYLEKILQLAVDLPSVPREVLDEQVFEAITDATGGIPNPGRFDESSWPDCFVEIIRPLIRNVRDIRRYAAAVRGSVKALNGRIALVDVLALEAIRVFLPDVFVKLPAAVEALTTTSFHGEPHKTHKAVIDDLIAGAGPQAAVIQAGIQRLFPAALRHVGNTIYGPEWESQWIRERRAAHKDILRLYLEQTATAGLRTFQIAELAWSKMANEEDFRTYLATIDLQELESVIRALEAFEEEFRPEHVVPGVATLLNLLPSIPERPRRMFEFGPTITVTRVTLRLLRSLKDPQRVEDAVRTILPQLRHLSTKRELIQNVGYQEGAGHRLVSEDAARSLERAWRDDVRAATPEALAAEPDLLRVLFFARRSREASEPPIAIPAHPSVTWQLIRTARSEALSQSISSRAVRREPRLAWQVLEEISDGEAKLDERIDQVRESGLEVDSDDWALVEKYRRGWRPET